MVKFLNDSGLTRLVALIKQAINGKADKTELPLLVTYDGRSADYTYNEIKAAFDAGRIVEVKYNKSSGITVGRYRLVSSTLGVFIFTEVGGVDREMGKLTLSNATGWSYTSTDLQDELVSGTNIKTINNTSLLGSGNISIEPNQITSITTTESTVSGGNNTVTISETNGTSHTFNVKNGIDGQDGQDGADGVSLGEVALVQTTGDSEESVMSQKAVTEYGRKLTAEDYNATSSYIKNILTTQGWEFGKYVNSSGTLTASASYCATPYIEIGNLNNHTITFRYKFNGSNAACVVFYDDNNVKQNYWTCNVNTARTVGISNVANATKLRISLNANDLRGCYIYDNTAGEYLFKSTPHIENALATDNATVGYGTFENYMLANELGTNEWKAVSQKIANDIQSNVDAIGRRSFGMTAVFDAYSTATYAKSVKKWNTSTQPMITVVCFNASVGNSQRGDFFGLSPNNMAGAGFSSASNYIGFKANTWSTKFIIRRDGTTVYDSGNQITMTSQMTVGYQLDFRHKKVRIMGRSTAGALTDKTLDLSSYDIDFGDCYMYTSLGYCSYCADFFVGYNTLTNELDFSAFFTGGLVAGKFKRYAEHMYPSDSYNGQQNGVFTTFMTNWSPTTTDEGHIKGTLNSASSFVSLHYAMPSNTYNFDWSLVLARGKIKATGEIQIENNPTGYSTLRDVYDETEGAYIVPNGEVYTIPSGHTVDVRVRMGVNTRNGGMLFFKGACDVEMWGWETLGIVNSNLCAENYDGKKIFGGIEFLYDYPNLVIDLPLMSTSSYYVQGLFLISSDKVYTRVFNASSYTFVNKQISNT